MDDQQNNSNYSRFAKSTKDSIDAPLMAKIMAMLKANPQDMKPPTGDNVPTMDIAPARPDPEAAVNAKFGQLQNPQPNPMAADPEMMAKARMGQPLTPDSQGQVSDEDRARKIQALLALRNSQNPGQNNNGQ